MRIVWHRHSCFEIEDDVTIVIDPHDGKSIGVKPPTVKADLVLISHDHFDHNAVRIVRGDFTVIKDVAQKKVKGVAISGITAFHDTEKGERRGTINIFKFILNGVTFCHCGDIGHLLSDEQLRELGNIDVLFVPVGGVFTINGTEAQQLIRSIKPKVAIPMHFRVGGLSLSIHTLDEFLEGIPEDGIVRVGNEVEFDPEDLPDECEYWVFSQ